MAGAEEAILRLRCGLVWSAKCGRERSRAVRWPLAGGSGIRVTANSADNSSHTAPAKIARRIEGGRGKVLGWSITPLTGVRRIQRCCARERCQVRSETVGKARGAARSDGGATVRWRPTLLSTSHCDNGPTSRYPSYPPFHSHSQRYESHVIQLEHLRDLSSTCPYCRLPNHPANSSISIIRALAGPLGEANYVHTRAIDGVDGHWSNCRPRKNVTRYWMDSRWRTYEVLLKDPKSCWTSCKLMITGACSGLMRRSSNRGRIRSGRQTLVALTVCLHA